MAGIEDYENRIGEELLALVMSWQLGVSHRTALKNMKAEPGKVNPSWGKLAWKLQCGLVDGVHATRATARVLKQS